MAMLVITRGYSIRCATKVFYFETAECRQCLDHTMEVSMAFFSGMTSKHNIEICQELLQNLSDWWFQSL